MATSTAPPASPVNHSSSLSLRGVSGSSRLPGEAPDARDDLPKEVLCQVASASPRIKLRRSPEQRPDARGDTHRECAPEGDAYCASRHACAPNVRSQPSEKREEK